MRKFFQNAERYRTQLKGFPPTKRGDRYGLFIMAQPTFNIRMMVDDGAETGWEHVSVSCKVQHPDGRIQDVTPPWDTMNMVKLMFWKDEECVLQFHPPRAVYVNRHESTLHLWRQVGVNHPTPPTDLV